MKILKKFTCIPKFCRNFWKVFKLNFLWKLVFVIWEIKSKHYGKMEESLMEKWTEIEKISKTRFSSGEDMLFTHPTFYQYYESTGPGLYGQRSHLIFYKKFIPEYILLSCLFEKKTKFMEILARNWISEFWDPSLHSFPVTGGGGGLNPISLDLPLVKYGTRTWYEKNKKIVQNWLIPATSQQISHQKSKTKIPIEETLKRVKQFRNGHKIWKTNTPNNRNTYF